MTSGEMSSPEFTTFLTTAFANLAEHIVEAAVHFLCVDWRHMNDILSAGQGVYEELKNLIVWVKDNGRMGTINRSCLEPIFVLKKGTAPHTTTFELGQHGR